MGGCRNILEDIFVTKININILEEIFVTCEQEYNWEGICYSEYRYIFGYLLLRVTQIPCTKQYNAMQYIYCNYTLVYLLVNVFHWVVIDNPKISFNYENLWFDIVHLLLTLA